MIMECETVGLHRGITMMTIKGSSLRIDHTRLCQVIRRRIAEQTCGRTAATQGEDLARAACTQSQSWHRTVNQQQRNCKKTTV